MLSLNPSQQKNWLEPWLTPQRPKLLAQTASQLHTIDITTHKLSYFTEAFYAITEGHTLPHQIFYGPVFQLFPGKDPLFCDSYRPIFLLNCDINLFAKILANRISSLLQRIISPDQAGSIQSREARENAIRTLNVIAKANTSNTALLRLSTDAKKDL